MELKGRNATWLELAAAPARRLDQKPVRIHRLSDTREACVGITVDERWVCANDGRLTVFGGRDAALRFLGLLRVDRTEEGEAATLGACCGSGKVLCLRMGHRGLRGCKGKPA